MYVFHRNQHIVQSYSNAEFFFVLLFPLVDRMASFYGLIIDKLVCWFADVVFNTFEYW